jgi:hypothetical protein
MTQPFLRVKRGNPTDEELAAVAAVLAALFRTRPPAQPQRLVAPIWLASRRPGYTPPTSWQRAA